jgi:8-oxo-dGTP diphosphatase
MERIEFKDFIKHIAIDCVLFGFEEGQLKVLVSTLNMKGDFYALPNGFVYLEEDTDAAAQRILKERTGLDNIYLEEFKVFGKANRNNKAFIDELIRLNKDELLELNFDELKKKNFEAPIDLIKNSPDYQWITQRFIGIGYYALVNIKEVKLQLTNIDASLDWYHIQELPKMIMDGNEITMTALKTLRYHIDEKINAFNLLPETFTMKEVQELYEAISGKTFERANFQKMVLSLNVLERLEKKYTGAKNKAPYLYRFISPQS